jgi:CheY-like chemotaxis protein
VVIVDDHPEFRESASALLEAEGFAVIGEAADGDEAKLELHKVSSLDVFTNLLRPPVHRAGGPRTTFLITSFSFQSLVSQVRLVLARNAHGLALASLRSQTPPGRSCSRKSP